MGRSINYQEPEGGWCFAAQFPYMSSCETCIEHQHMCEELAREQEQVDAEDAADLAEVDRVAHQTVVTWDSCGSAARDANRSVGIAMHKAMERLVRQDKSNQCTVDDIEVGDYFEGRLSGNIYQRVEAFFTTNVVAIEQPRGIFREFEPHSTVNRVNAKLVVKR